MNKILLSISFAAATMIAADASIYTAVHDVETYHYGFERKEAFDIGIYINDVNLKDAKIIGIRVPVVTEAQVNDAGYSVWLSNELNLKANIFTPDIVKKTAEVKGEWAEAMFDEPITITDALYAGYSFTLKGIETDYDKRPLVLANCGFGENNLWLHTSHTYRSWLDFGENVNASTPLQVIIDGSSLRSDAAAFVDTENIYVEKGKDNTYYLEVANHGNNAITSISYEYRIGEAVYRADEVFDTPIAADYYGERCKIGVSLPTFDQCSSYDCEIAITNVNGKDNNDARATSYHSITSLPFITKHRPMVEEYTGLWCGYCPTGYVGLKLLSEHIKDDVVIVSIHNNDPMEVLKAKDYPYAIEGYPDMWFDRTASTDPFFGNNLNNMYGLDNLWLYHANKLAICDIDISAAYDDESQKTITADATVRFLYDNDNARYKVGFYLVADDLNDAKWFQTNYYSTGNQMLPIEMEEFTKGEMKVGGLHFDDVLVAYSNVKGIEGSLPHTIISGEEYKVSYQFDIAGNKVIQDKKKLKAIAFVVNAETGLIENAISLPLYKEDTGSITFTECDNINISNVKIYNLQGIEVKDTAMPGIYIINGKKVLVK